MGTEQENMRHIIRDLFESSCIDENIEVETELGKVDYVFTSRYKGNFCVNIVEIKTPSEVRGKQAIDKALRELLYYSAAIHFHNNYKHCKYYKGYVAIDQLSFKKGFLKLKVLKDKLNRYGFGLLITDLKTRTAKEKIRPKPKRYRDLGLK
ncbi:MAG: hypothetical protein QXF61_10355 [Nitrososphaeria archaeon]